MADMGAGAADVALTKRAYDEVVGLLVEARNYAAFRQPQERAGRDQLARLKMSCESFRVTTRLTQVLAWLMALRALERGEITRSQLCGASPYRLGGQEVCLEDGGENDADLPEGLRDLLRRSHALYQRMARLDAMVAEQGDGP